MSFFDGSCIEASLISAGAAIVVAIIGFFAVSSSITRRSCRVVRRGICYDCMCDSEEQTEREAEPEQIRDQYENELTILRANHELVLSRRDQALREFERRNAALSAQLLRKTQTHP